LFTPLQARLRSLFREQGELERPLRDELSSIEQLEERARALGARLTIDPEPGRAADRSYPRLEDNARLLVMRSYPGTLLDSSCAMAVREHRRYAEQHGVPWGISESAFNVVDRHDTYQYKAFGVPRLGFKRGLGDELVVAPYATALAAMVEPAAAVRNLRRLAEQGVRGPYGFYESIDYTHGPASEDGERSAPSGHR
jgi:hypothetical protein